jgi:hypothetical protein
MQRFDIFWFGNKDVMWLEAVDTLEIAKAHIKQLPPSSSGSYGVMDLRNGKRISFETGDDKRTSLFGLVNISHGRETTGVFQQRLYEIRKS